MPSPDTAPGLAQWFAAQHTVREGLTNEHQSCSAEHAAEIVGQVMRDLKTTDALAQIDKQFHWSKEREYASDLIVLGSALLSLALDQNMTKTEYEGPATAISDLFFNTKSQYPLFIKVLFDRNINHARSVWAVTMRAVIERSHQKGVPFETAFSQIVEAVDQVVEADMPHRLPQISSSLPENIDQWI